MPCGLVDGHVLLSLDGYDAHGWNGPVDAFGKATEAAIFLDGDLHVGVVVSEAICFLDLGFLPDRLIHKVLVESFREQRRTRILQFTC